MFWKLACPDFCRFLHIMCLVYNSFMVIYVLVHVGTRNADLSRPNIFLPFPMNGYQMANKKRKYIWENPWKWESDELNPRNKFIRES
jgi:hypothetical protein